MSIKHLYYYSLRVDKATGLGAIFERLLKEACPEIVPNSHVKTICTKVNNQVNLISLFRKIVQPAVKCKIYKAFIVPCFRYCSAVWHFCGARNRDKLEKINKRAFKIVLNEKYLDYQGLLNEINCSNLYSTRC